MKKKIMKKKIMKKKVSKKKFAKKTVNLRPIHKVWGPYSNKSNKDHVIIKYKDDTRKVMKTDKFIHMVNRYYKNVKIDMSTDLQLRVAMKSELREIDKEKKKSNISIVAYRKTDEEWEKMRAVHKACKEADVDVPWAVKEFFVGRDPESIPEVKQEVLISNECLVKYESGAYGIDLRKLPDDIVAFYIEIK